MNCHHNYTEREKHGGAEMWITRKGAIKAEAGDMGVIPGSMGTDSYIVRGKGNPASMTGKAWNSDSATALIDEDPRAYKDIKQVMADQSDLTEVVHVLTQVLNYKGT